MPRPSKVEQLPPELRKELDAALVERGFSGYEELADWLAGRGHEISKSSLGRYGKDFKARLGALRLASAQAKEIVSAMGDDEGAMGEALTSLAQERAFGVLMNMDASEQDVRIDQLLRSIAKLGSTDVKQKSFRLEVRQRARQTAEEVEERLREEGGVSEDTVERIRADIIGVAA